MKMQSALAACNGGREEWREEGRAGNGTNINGLHASSLGTAHPGGSKRGRRNEAPGARHFQREKGLTSVRMEKKPSDGGTRLRGKGLEH
ncbi:hypothetical protein Naga_100655g1 [Nannochloropsis gaditana]|uniref:Uncharacterized protein n=1 Tax=Nannochloropsis gaditana TaxID=72520 RepID=W7TJ78_9STRA|nr:hypothetical protein Naga_100655g1 [Nannochloropsis gaditana]